MPRPYFTSQGFIVFVILCLLNVNALRSQTLIAIAGGIGDNQSARTFGRLYPGSLAITSSGDLIICDNGNFRIRRLDHTGNLTTIAGINSSGYGGIGGPAVYAPMFYPNGVATDAAGNIYIALENHIGKIDATGIFTVVAGNYLLGNGFSGDGGLATNAQIGSHPGITVDASGNIYIADVVNKRVRKVSTSGVINTIAGGGSLTADSISAVTAALNDPAYLAVDAAGNVYVSDGYGYKIRKISTSGIITTVVGGGYLNLPKGLTIDPHGNLYIADYQNFRVVKVDTLGQKTVIAGNGTFGYSGDGGPATAAQIRPQDVKLDANGNLYIVDVYAKRIRRVDTSGNISSVAGNGVDIGGFDGDGNYGTLAKLDWAAGVCRGPDGSIYFADKNNNRIRKIDNAGIITTVAGNGIVGFYGDGGMATNAELDHPDDIAVDTAGNLFISDINNHRIRMVTTAGTIITYAGGGVGGLGDGGPASAATINASGIAADVYGNLFIADKGNNRVRQVSPAGIINTIAGIGIPGASGDGGAATAAELSNVIDVTADQIGNVYISDAGRIRKIDASGIITTITSGADGSIAADSSGNVYYKSGYGVNLIDVSGSISHVAGYGNRGYMGDGGPATAAEFMTLGGLTVDRSGNLIIGDYNAVRCSGCSPYPVTTGIEITPAIAFAGSMYSVFPNPAKNALTIAWNKQGKKNTRVTISDAMGRSYYYGTVDMSDQTGTATIDISGITPGIYFITLRSAESHFCSRLVIF